MTDGRVLFVGLDAMDPEISRGLADAGAAPTLRALFDTAAWAETSDPPGLIGALWPSVWTGVWPGRHGSYWPRQLVNRSYETRPTTRDDIDREPFWGALARAGRSVRVFDMPLAPVHPYAGCAQIVEWGSHDRALEPTSWPASALSDLQRELGPYALTQDCDEYAQRQAWSQLRDDLVLGVEQKTRATKAALTSGDWDLVATVFAESHCAAHHLWPLHEHAGAADAYTPGDDYLIDVYGALDRGLGELVEAAGDETTTVVFLSHGVAWPCGTDHLLGEVLVRLGDHYGASSRFVTYRERIARPVDRRRHERRLRRASPDHAAGSSRVVSVDSSKPFFKVAGDGMHGGVRFNLKGREPRGLVRPGPELEGLVDRLRADLLDLVDPESGLPAVNGVLRVAELYEGERIDDLPDLLIEWNPEAGRTAVASPRVGTIRGAPWPGRAGEHRPRGLLLVRGPGTSAGPVGDIGAVDIAPTITKMLGIEPADLDGRVVDSLLPAR